MKSPKVSEEKIEEILNELVGQVFAEYVGASISLEARKSYSKKYVNKVHQKTLALLWEVGREVIGTDEEDWYDEDQPQSVVWQQQHTRNQFRQEQRKKLLSLISGMKGGKNV